MLRLKIGNLLTPAVFSKAETLPAPGMTSPTRKRFFKEGQPMIDIGFQDFAQFGNEWQARKIHVAHPAGSLDVALVDYTPGFAFDDAKLTVRP